MRRRVLLAIALLVLAAGGCTELDDTVVVAVSTMVPSLADSDLDSQIILIGDLLDDGTIQNVYFETVPVIDLTLDEFEEDMTFGEECQFFQAWNTPAFAFGKCASGVIVDGDDQLHDISLDVEITAMKVQRTPPLFLLPEADRDSDGVNNADDNCPLVDNPDQTDTGQKGYGDVCAIFDFAVGIPRKDSDADTIPDSSDNCPFTPNPGQEDSGFVVGSITVPDGIGDACTTETATVTVSETLSKVPEENQPLPLRRVRWLTLDIRDQVSLQGCWDDFQCELTNPAVVLCIDDAGGFGCP
jgi:hypothetical protein